MNNELSAKDLKEIESFKNGFPWMNIIAPATIGRGILKADENLVNSALETADNALNGKCGKKVRISKFVPASGAASRMFKDLFSKKADVVEKFAANIEKFAFYDKADFGNRKGEELVDFTLGTPGLGYGAKPKGVLKFHRYADEVRTALAEHFIEAKEYVTGKDRVADIIVTISPEHRPLFEEAIKDIKDKYERKYNCTYNVKLVYQYKWTDTIAVNPDNTPFVTDEGKVLHRPGGHGALINNLNEMDSDVVVIKNIDNVAVEKYLPITAKWKKVLIGTALNYSSKVNNYITALKSAPTESLCSEIEAFLKNDFCIELPCDTVRSNLGLYAKTLMNLLNRPLRVCGMVKNEGEPGGGPFVIREKDGSTSLQILEGSQINPDDEKSQACLKGATHFNPVDLVCVLTDGEGKKYDLTGFVDENAGFISSKSYQGKELKALELPGLWNGAMSRWNTLFIEVPIETFNPVKTVMDLLRPAHQNG